MRRFLCFFLGLLLCIAPAFALETDHQDEPNYIHIGDSGFPIEYLCQAIGAEITYNDDDERIEPTFDENLLKRLEEYQMENGLEASGVFDPATLCCILRLPDSSIESPLIWIPMHGGIRYHIKPECSKMYEPRQMPVDCARAFFLTSCGKCTPDAHLGIGR